MISHFQKYHAVLGEFAELINEDIESKTRPPFLLDVNPWNQFLDKNGPGCGLELPHSDESTSTQVIPIPGIKLLGTMSYEVKELRKDLRLNSTKSTNASEPKYKPPFQAGVTKPNCVSKAVALIPSPFMRYERRFWYDHKVPTLENLGKALCHSQGHPRLRPESERFPVTVIRKWAAVRDAAATDADVIRI
ncbi:MAG: hypothetical protein M1837_003135 [Sclerophora amabilis]|nr:MAG: hypothetical protein M1837_003135 [Sclerophora amabilis]